MAWITDLIFPPTCAHCQAPLPSQNLFCPLCLEQLTPLDTEERCPYCFSETHRGKCALCCKRRVLIHRTLSIAEGIGPAYTLAKGIERGEREWIPAAASLMAYQWIQKQMPSCDLLVPLPCTLHQRLRYGKDLHNLLAQQIGNILSLPVHQALKRGVDWDHFFTEAEVLPRFEAFLPKTLADRSILLIALSYDDALFRRAAEALTSAYPIQISALTLMREFG
ncbi:MAG: hypothetical protein JSS61_06850 [Verrucomicrobia bacterium]|nr:hypothetical protein [Verrucomicrobiota bacterium]